MRIIISLIAISALAACDRPKVLVVCHNSNCAEPTDPSKDDTLEALRTSLALQVSGRPAIDGVELDLFWRASDSVCLFAHDLEGGTTELAATAATELGAYLAAPGAITWSDGNFQLFIELKAHVGASASERHSPAQRMQHVACAWDFYTTVTNGARSGSRTVDVFFGSFSPDLLRDLIAATPVGIPFPPRYEAFYGVPKPLDTETRPLSDYTGIPIDFVEMHSQWIHDAQYEGLISSGIEIGFFMFSATVETFAAIEQYEPTIVNTSEAQLMRRWLEN